MSFFKNLKKNSAAFFQRLWAWMKNPKGWHVGVLWAATLLSAGGAIVCMLLLTELPWAVVSYLSYALAATVLFFAVFTTVTYAPRLKNACIRNITRTEFGRRMLEQYSFRTVIFSIVAFGFNVLYVLFHAVVAVISKSIWYGALAFYYLLLTAMRGRVLFFHAYTRKGLKENPASLRTAELKTYRTCGIMLTVLPLCLSAAIVQVVAYGTAFVHLGWTVFAFAAYAFYKVTMGILNTVKAYRHTDYSIRALRDIGLADAMVSILALQTSLLYNFATGSVGVYNAVTGGVICLLTVILGVIITVHANVRLQTPSKRWKD